jgi:hypothetical protein
MEKIEKFNHIIDEVGQEYTKWFYDNAVPSVSGKPILNGEGILTRGEFINKCKTDTEFSEKWGLKIEERELTPKERIELAGGKIQDKYPALVEMSLRVCDERNIPTKLITMTYKDTKIESYE